MSSGWGVKNSPLLPTNVADDWCWPKLKCRIKMEPILLDCKAHINITTLPSLSDAIYILSIICNISLKLLIQKATALWANRSATMCFQNRTWKNFFLSNGYKENSLMTAWPLHLPSVQCSGSDVSEWQWSQCPGAMSWLAGVERLRTCNSLMRV